MGVVRCSDRGGDGTSRLPPIVKSDLATLVLGVGGVEWG